MAQKPITSIEWEIYDGLAAFLEGKISGGFYPRESRPLDSHVEDAVITVTNASPDQIQNGTARLNIYVPDEDVGIGHPTPKRERIDVLAELGASINEILNDNIDSDYEFGRPTVNLIAAPNDEHIVNIVIPFQRVTFNS